jgi:acetyltransferase-like isoleucine patch superfamily enzyme
MIDILKGVYRQIKKKVVFFFSINWLKTIYFNFKMLPIEQAKILPFYFYGKVCFSNLSGKVIIDSPIMRGMIGFGQPYEKTTKSKGIAELVLEGTLCFKGYVQFGKDYFIYVARNAYGEFGHFSSMASNGKLICTEKVVLGSYARIGSESQIMDTNFHQMVNTASGEKYPMTLPIIIGDYNYIGNRVSIMQNTKTSNFCTIASNSLCNKDYRSFGENVLIGGIPAKLIKENISRDWEGENEMLQQWLIIH